MRETIRRDKVSNSVHKCSIHFFRWELMLDTELETEDDVREDQGSKRRGFHFPPRVNPVLIDPIIPSLPFLGPLQRTDSRTHDMHSSARGMHLKRRCYDRPRLCCRLANHERTPHPIPLRRWAAFLTASRSKVLLHA
ncbi:hypothetical protein BDV06DRAFT_90695 [Aspergillus oleicola]